MIPSRTLRWDNPDRHRRAWLAERRDLVTRQQRLRQRAVA